MIVYKDTIEDIDRKLVQDIDSYLEQGYESIAIICKTASESENLYIRLKDLRNIKLVNSNVEEIEKGITVIPAYISKGLEFDVALVYNVSQDNYATEFDRRLLYIACTRALHRLTLYYTGAKSPLI